MIPHEYAPNPYAYLLGFPNNAIAETGKDYQYFSERHLQIVWLEQKFFSNLTTHDGQPIKVISPGIWNGEAGPDFRKAHLSIGGREIQGDIEVHLADEGWIHHHHHADSRYNQVILNVSLWKPRQDKPLTTSLGKPIAKAYLEEFLTLNPTRIIYLLDLDLYPYRKFIGSGKCAQLLFRPLKEEKIKHFFELAFQYRLEQKLKYFMAKVMEPSLFFGAGIAMGLGYKHNTEPFINLFLHLKEFTHLSEREFLALGLGITGFFSDALRHKWKGSSYFMQLLDIYQSLSTLTPFSIAFVKGKIRPLNHPIRRLVYLSKLLADPALVNMHLLLTGIWNSQWFPHFEEKKWNQLRDLLKLQIPVYTDEYWNYHYNFEETTRKQFLTLMGDDLREEILINTFLPILFEQVQRSANPQEKAAFREFYLSFPASQNSKTEYLVHRFFGDSPKGLIMHKACYEQGAYQLHKDFCLHYEASCEGCPFVENYNSKFRVCL